jgi:hypothetical protein
VCTQAARPEGARSNTQYSRYLFYLGRIRAVQLEYSEAKECLQQAARKVRRPLVHCVCTSRYAQSASAERIMHPPSQQFNVTVVQLPFRAVPPVPTSVHMYGCLPACSRVFSYPGR